MDIDVYEPYERHEDISLPENMDQIHAGYIRISFGEDNSSLSGNDSQSMGMPIEESPCPRTPTERNTGGPREVIRDGGHDVSLPRQHLVLSDRVEPDPELVTELSNSNSNNNSSLPTIGEMVVETDGLHLQSNQTPAPESTHSEPVNHNLDPHFAPTPPFELEPEQPRAKRRKIRYDEATVLTNEFMNKSVKDHSDLLRKRKGVPCSSLDAWRLNNRRKKEKAFFHPIITGLMGTPQSGSSSGRQRSLLEIGSLQARTRAVAQYIKEKSSATFSTPQNAGSVLKSCDLVEVKQDEPYADIILKVTSKLAKHHFSN